MDDIYYTIFTEKDNICLNIQKYYIRFSIKGCFKYEVFTLEKEYYKHLKNYFRYSEALKRVAEELEKEGQ